MTADTLPLAPPWMAPLLDLLNQILAELKRPCNGAAVDNPWLSAAELADLLGVSERSVRTWEQAGKLPRPVRVGRLKKWNRAEVERHLAKTTR